MQTYFAFHRSWSKEDLTWLSGFFEGEGCAYVGWHKNRQFRYRLSVDSTSVSTIQWLHKTFGGRLVRRKIRLNRKPQSRWSLTGIAAQELFKLISPMFKCKRKRLEASLWIDATARISPKGGGRMDGAEIERRNMAIGTLSRIRGSSQRRHVARPLTT